MMIVRDAHIAALRLISLTLTEQPTERPANICISSSTTSRIQINTLWSMQLIRTANDEVLIGMDYRRYLVTLLSEFGLTFHVMFFDW